MDPNGNFKVIKGVSNQNPPTPADSDDGMTLYTLFLGAYTFSPDDVTSEFRENKRFTMRDIGRLEDRITNLEYFTSLSLLEKAAELKSASADQQEQLIHYTIKSARPPLTLDTLLQKTQDAAVSPADTTIGTDRMQGNLE